jgi:signal transduction histidine kinase
MADIPFPTVLASTVHDMKNSLGMLLQSLDAILQRVPEEQRSEMRELGVLQYEAARVNTTLVQLLALYKLEQDQLPLNIGYHGVLDFVESITASHTELLAVRHIEVEFAVDDELSWFFDYDLCASVINNVVTNTIRYTKNKIMISAWIEENQLIIEISDDGPGYPANMVEQAASYMLGINHSTGSTGLGLFFAGQVAQLHQKNNQKGHIALQNGRRLPGGEFRLYLP